MEVFWFWKRDLKDIAKAHKKEFVAAIKYLKENAVTATGNKLNSEIVYEQVIPFHRKYNELVSNGNETGRLRTVDIENDDEKLASKFNSEMSEILRRQKYLIYGYLAWLWAYQPEYAMQFYNEIGIKPPKLDLDVLINSLRNSILDDLQPNSVNVGGVVNTIEVKRDINDNLDLHAHPPSFVTDLVLEGVPSFVGREEEPSTLRRFLENDKPVLWLQISGEHGIGKTTLARELISIAASDNWCSGFVGRSTLDRMTGRWNSWQPSKPHLLVLKDFHSQWRQVHELIVAPQSKAGQLSDYSGGSPSTIKKIRVIFLERSP